MGANRTKCVERQEITDYLHYLKLMGRSEGTRKVYRGRLQVLDEWLAARGVDLLRATPEDLGEWRAGLQLMPNTVVMYVSAARGFYKWACRSGRIRRDPAWAIPVPPKRPGLPRPIADRLLVRAIDSAPAYIRIWLVLAAYVGLRCCEIAWLDRADILDDLDEPVMVIRGKGGKVRVVDLSPYVLAELRAADLPKAGPAFPRRDGNRGHNTPNLISTVANRYLHSLGIKETMHQLRHRFGTAAWQATLDMRLVQELLGHSSPATTAVYTQFARPKARAAVAAIQPEGWRKAHGSILRSVD